jgi:hypothetical protein
VKTGFVRCLSCKGWAHQNCTEFEGLDTSITVRSELVLVLIIRGHRFGMSGAT